MSDLRVTAVCSDCGKWISGTDGIYWTAEHVDIYPDHRVVVTKSGEVERTWPETHENPAQPSEED